MVIMVFIIVLLATIQITNKKNDAKASDEILEFTKGDSLIIFCCFLSSILINYLAKTFFRPKYLSITLVSGFIYSMILVIVNANREKFIKKKHDQILDVFQALTDILGKVDREKIDFNNIPFTIEENKNHQINKIVLDTSISGGKVNDNTIILAQYSINKFFPELQWISSVNYQERELIFKGLPKPPTVAKFPGTDYRPTGWIPLGLNGEGEVGWNIADPKDLGTSSYKYEDGRVPETVITPSAPQCLTLGSTGGGKAIWEDQIVDVL